MNAFPAEAGAVPGVASSSSSRLNRSFTTLPFVGAWNQALMHQVNNLRRIQAMGLCQNLASERTKTGAAPVQRCI